MKNPYIRNNQLNSERSALSQTSSQTHKWLTEFLDKAALYFCNCIFRQSLVSLTTKKFCDSKLSGKSYTWKTCWNSIRIKLSDEDPCILFERLITMVFPRDMSLVEWTSAFLLATDLCEQELEIKLPMQQLRTDRRSEAQAGCSWAMSAAKRSVG